MGLSSFPPAVGTRLITKSGSSGNTLLPPPGSGLASVTTATTSLTYGSWAQIAASTAAEYLITAIYARTVESNASIPPWYLDIGTGAGGSESVIASLALDVLAANTSLLTNALQQLAIPLRVAAGTRIAARAQAQNVGGFARTVNILLYVTPYVNAEGN